VNNLILKVFESREIILKIKRFRVHLESTRGFENNEIVDFFIEVVLDGFQGNRAQ
jgi:hypothetical protein